MASPWHARAGLAFALLTFALVIATVLMLLHRDPPQGEPASEPEPTTRARPILRQVQRIRSATPSCSPKGAACHAGDVWLMDTCGGATERLETCAAGCENGSCRDPESPPQEVGERCIGLSEHGVCEGEEAVGCAGGQPFRIDCAAVDKRCVMTSEGAVCRAVSERDCGDEPPQCDEDTLRYCGEGLWQQLDCRSQGARCDSASGRCVAEGGPAASSEGECGPCGCAAGPVGEEVCDGRDNDGDGDVDEDVVCEPIPLLFFVAGDRPGSSRAELEGEVTRLNQTFAGSGEGARGDGLSFSLLDVVEVDRLDWIEPDETTFSTMARAPRLHPERDAFYIPVIMVASLGMGDVPKAGVATIPNGVCGGVRRAGTAQLPVGLVLVADRRSPTTLAHEIGHFLGLCHTHQNDDDVVRTVVLSGEGEPIPCEEACAAEGDGICDTPTDPGVQSCSPNRACEVSCADEEEPDPRNIMSYYTWCRQAFSPEQLKLMRTSLWLRRGWHRCVTASADATCTCTPGLRECPEGMSCAPHISGATCELDGPLAPGAGPCASHLDCSQESMCISGPGGPTCARACMLNGPGCTCVEVRGELRACREDLSAREAER